MNPDQPNPVDLPRALERTLVTSHGGPYVRAVITDVNVRTYVYYFTDGDVEYDYCSN